MSESTLAHNPEHAYMRNKVEAEQAFLAVFAERGFPLTIVRPAHTYDEAVAPLPGGWVVIDRIERGEPVVVQGDGTSMWTYTHAADFAVGLVGLLGRPSAFGEAFHITSDDVLSWNQIYLAIGHAMGVKPRILHIPTDLIMVGEPDWFWSGLLDGDLSHTETYDNTKIGRYVPGFRPTRFFEREDLQDPRLAQRPPRPRQGSGRRPGGLHTAGGEVRAGARRLRQSLKTSGAPPICQRRSGHPGSRIENVGDQIAV